MNIYLQLFTSFAKIGVLTFGGGMAMLPMLQREVVESKGWATEEEITDYFAISQCIPGIIAANVATFVGRKMKGFGGGIVAALGVIFPSVVIIMILAAFLSGFADIIWVQKAFAGIRVAVCVLVINAVVKLFKKNVTNLPTVLIFLAVFAGATFAKVSPVIFVLLAAAAGIIIKGLEAKK